MDEESSDVFQTPLAPSTPQQPPRQVVAVPGTLPPPDNVPGAQPVPAVVSATGKQITQDSIVSPTGSPGRISRPPSVGPPGATPVPSAKILPPGPAARLPVSTGELPAPKPAEITAKRKSKTSSRGPTDDAAALSAPEENRVAPASQGASKATPAGQTTGSAVISTQPVDATPFHNHPSTLPKGYLTIAEFRQVLQSLETRIARCEALLGDARLIEQGREKARQKLQEELALAGDGYFSSGMDERRRKWESDLDFATSPTVAVGVQAERILGMANEALRGEPTEFDMKLGEMLEWMEAEGASVSLLLTSYATKRSFVLAHEAEIKSLAAQINQLDELKEYVNPPSFAGLSAQRERVNGLAARAFLLSNRANLLSKQVEETAVLYASAMNLFGATLGAKLSESAHAAGVSPATKGRRKSVAFG